MFVFQPAEDGVLGWSEKQRIEYTAHTAPGTKKGEALPVTAHVVSCLSADFIKVRVLCRHQPAAPPLLQSGVCGVQLVPVVGEGGLLQSRAACEH